MKQNLIRLGVKPGDKLGIAVSGGADSMVLLHLLHRLAGELGVELTAYHMEHGIRGEASEADMHFVQRACEQLGVPCITARADVPKIAQETGVSVEAAARQARYAFLGAQEADFVATAHHMDDNAETVLMNLVRGSGAGGLSGIPEKRGRYIRPLLGLSRQQIKRFAQDEGIAFVHDASNDDTRYTRNFVRGEVMPVLKRINDAAAANIARAARALAEDDAALRGLAEHAGGMQTREDGVHIDIAVMTAQPAAVQKRMLLIAAEKAGGRTDLSAAHLDDLAALAQKAKSGKQIDLPGALVARVVYGRLVIGKTRDKRYNDALVPLQMQGRVETGGFVFESELGDVQPEFGADAEWFDADAVGGAVFRRRRQGDYIVPLGMTGAKRLCDYLSDRKVPLHERDEVVVLASGSEVFWAVGAGVSEHSKIKAGSRAVKIKYWEK